MDGTENEMHNAVKDTDLKDEDKNSTSGGQCNGNHVEIETKSRERLMTTEMDGSFDTDGTSGNMKSDDESNDSQGESKDIEKMEISKDVNDSVEMKNAMETNDSGSVGIKDTVSDCQDSDMSDAGSPTKIKNDDDGGDDKDDDEDERVGSDGKEAETSSKLADERDNEKKIAGVTEDKSDKHEGGVQTDAAATPMQTDKSADVKDVTEDSNDEFYVSLQDSSFSLTNDPQDSSALMCQQCVKSFEVTEEFQEHVLGHLVQDSLTESSIDEDGWATCPVCLQMFPEISMFEEHVRKHVNNIFTCVVCNMTFRERKSLEDHVSKVHNRDRPFKCSECGKMLKSIAILAKHLKNTHQKELTLCCDQCSFTCSSREELNQHVKENHKKARKKSKTFNCEICSEIFSTKKELKSHMKSGHATVETGGSEPSETMDVTIASPKLGETLKPAVIERKRPSSADDNDDKSNAKRRKSSRIASLESKIFMCTLCTEKFSSEEEWHGHVVGRHGAVVDDFGNIRYQKKERKTSKPRRRSGSRKNSTSSSTSKEKAESPVYLEDDFEVDESSENSPEDSQDEDYMPGMEDTTCGATPKRRTPQKAQLDKVLSEPVPNTFGLKCEICFSMFGSPMLLKKHVMKKHAPPIQCVGSSYLCPYCPKQLPSESDVDRHITLYHPIKDIIEKAKVHNKTKLVTSSVSVEASNPSFLAAYKTNLEMVNKSNADDKCSRIYNCHLCTKSFISMTTLLSHIRVMHQNIHTPKDPAVHTQPTVTKQNIKPAVQTMPLVQKQTLKAASTSFARIAPKPTNQATVISTAMVNNNVHSHTTPSTSYRTPIKKVIKQFHYGCSVCEAVFLKEAELEQHIIAVHQIKVTPNHKEKRPYACQICSKRFMQLNSVMLHVILGHNKEGLDNVSGPRCAGLPGADSSEPERFTCPTCLQEFHQRHHLAFHVQKNTCRPSTKPKRVIMHGEDERPLPCPRCSGKYWGKSYLYMHIVEAHGNAALGEYVKKMKNGGVPEEPVVPVFVAPKTTKEEAPYPVALYQVNRTPTLPKLPTPNLSQTSFAKQNNSKNIMIDLTDDSPSAGTDNDTLTSVSATSSTSTILNASIRNAGSGLHKDVAASIRAKTIPSASASVSKDNIMVDLTEESDDESKDA